MPPINRTIIIDLLNQGDNAATNAERGRALEDVICIIFNSIPGITITERNCLNAALSEEIDIVFWNDQVRNGLWFLDNIIIIECKNWSGRVTHDEIDSFKNKLMRRKQTFGILVAANGITGEWHPPTAAYDTIQSVFREGIEIIIITQHEIRCLTSTKGLIELIKRKRVELAAYGTARLNVG